VPEGTVSVDAATRIVATVREPNAVRDLERLKWVGVLLPIGFIWGFELVRFLLVENHFSSSDAHVLSALFMATGVLIFGAAMALMLDRTQRQLVRQNRDLRALGAVGGAVRGDHPVQTLMRHAIERLVEETGAVAGSIRVRAHPDDLVERSPALLAEGMAWARGVLDEPAPVDRTPAYVEHPSLDALTLDLPLDLEDLEIGHARLVFQPARRPELTESILADLAREIATGIRLEQLLGDLRRREREQSALHEVALQLTGRAEMRVVLDTISHHARELLHADRAVVCLTADPARRSALPGERVAFDDEGAVCLVAHLGDGTGHPRNPLCPIGQGDAGGRWMARPLRAPDALLGELCVIRMSGPEFTEGEGRLLAGLADLAAVAVRTARLHETEQQWTILTERERIARELHDSLAQVLGQIHLRLRALEPGVDGSPIRAELADIADVADEAYRDVRESILGLRETISTKGGGLEASLREYLAKFQRQTGIVATLVCGRNATRDLEPRAEVQLLRVVQEALTNVRKHAGATRVEVRIATRAGAPVLSVEDDGAGFDPATVAGSMTGGFGLSAMRERVEQVGGRLEIRTAPGAGTRIVAHLEREGFDGAPATSAAASAGR
jgi:two-component system nitrate/nitrite sensor histidine kinase NarX